MWWVIGIVSLALLLALAFSTRSHPRRRSTMHDFERHTDTEHLYRY